MFLIFILFICGMEKLTRAGFQLIIWFIIWLIIGLNQTNSIHFLNNNWLVYVFQVILIFLIVYFLAPKLLFKKKYVLFGVVSVCIVLFLASISSDIIDARREFHRPPPNMPAGNLPTPFLINLLIISVAYGLAFFIETFLLALKKEEEIFLSKSENLETELKFLKSQINPHFLFNALNNIYSLSVIDAVKAQESIHYLSDMMRYVLYECEKPLVVIGKEVTYMEDFIKLFVLKSSKSYPIKVNFNIENPNLKLAPMLLIPFVENAFKHSNIHDINESFIAINLNSTNEYVWFCVENSLNKQRVSKDEFGGIGIRNVKKRLSLLYPESSTLLITESLDTFRVELKININA
jgi:two-component system LytT family sensor kinase